MNRIKIVVLLVIKIHNTVSTNEGTLFRSPKFHSEASEQEEKLSYYFTCTMYKPPAGGILQFYVNQRSIDTMRFYNKTCYNRFSICSTDKCSCSYNDYTFRWWHRASKTEFVNIFEVEMKFLDNQLGKIKSQLARIYNKTAIMDIKSDWQTMGMTKYSVDRTENSKRGLNTIAGIMIISSFVAGSIMGMLVIMCVLKGKMSCCHALHRKKKCLYDTQAEKMETLGLHNKKDLL